MPFNWHEYLDLARWLETNAPAGVSAEAAGRAAVSRAYYAAFCCARNYARDYLGFVPLNDTGDHGTLPIYLRKRRRTKTADSLKQLRDWRNECDYLDDLSPSVTAILNVASKDAEYVFLSLPPPAKP